MKPFNVTGEMVAEFRRRTKTLTVPKTLAERDLVARMIISIAYNIAVSSPWNYLEASFPEDSLHASEIEQQGYDFAASCPAWFAGVNACPYGPAAAGDGNGKAAAWYRGYFMFWYEAGID